FSFLFYTIGFLMPDVQYFPAKFFFQRFSDFIYRSFLKTYITQHSIPINSCHSNHTNHLFLHIFGLLRTKLLPLHSCSKRLAPLTLIRPPKNHTSHSCLIQKLATHITRLVCDVSSGALQTFPCEKDGVLLCVNCSYAPTGLI